MCDVVTLSKGRAAALWPWANPGPALKGQGKGQLIFANPGPDPQGQGWVRARPAIFR